MKHIKRIFLISLFCLSLILFPLVSQALNVQDVPNPRVNDGGWVTDMAEVLSPDTESQLNSMIDKLEVENGTEIAVVTIPKTDADTNTRLFANELFNHWGIGKAEEDNGILFLISKEDRQVRIETGYGIESILPDAKVGNILETSILPKLKEGNFDEGALNGTKALIQVLENTNIPVSSSLSTQSSIVAVLSKVSLSSSLSWKSRLILWVVSLLGVIMAVISYRHFKFRIIRPIYLKAGERTRYDGKDESQFWKESFFTATSFFFFAVFSIHAFLFSLIPLRFFLALLEVFLFLLVWITLQRRTIFKNWCLKQQESSHLKRISLSFLVGVAWFIIVIIPYSILRSISLFIIRENIGYALHNVGISESFSLGVAGGLTLAILSIQHFQENRKFCEQESKQVMEEVEPEVVFSALTKAERVAQELGSVEFKGWRVSDHSDLHIRAYILNKRKYSSCPHCQELTVTRKKKLLKSSSYSSEGKRLVIHQCHCCNYRREKEETIPRRSRSRSSSSVSTNYGGSYSSGSSGGSSGGDGGGGSFGGGSSGGGGADGGF